MIEVTNVVVAFNLIYLDVGKCSTLSESTCTNKLDRVGDIDGYELGSVCERILKNGAYRKSVISVGNSNSSYVVDVGTCADSIGVVRLESERKYTGIVEGISDVIISY